MKELNNYETMKINGGTTDAGSGGGSTTTIRDDSTRSLVSEMVGSTPQGGGMITSGKGGMPYSIR